MNAHHHGQHLTIDSLQNSNVRRTPNLFYAIYSAFITYFCGCNNSNASNLYILLRSIFQQSSRLSFKSNKLIYNSVEFAQLPMRVEPKGSQTNAKWSEWNELEGGNMENCFYSVIKCYVHFLFGHRKKASQKKRNIEFA